DISGHPRLPCQSPSGRERAATGRISRSLGEGAASRCVTASPRVRVAAELTAWLGIHKASGIGLGRDTTLASFLVAAYVYPARSRGLFVKAGVGVAMDEEHAADSRAAHGLALEAPGYDGYDL